MTEKFRFGTRSESNLVGVHPNHVKVVRLALSICAVDFAVTCGVRTIDEQRELFAQGRTKPGPVVTWTMRSRHLPQADGYGHAVDVCPVNPATGKLDPEYKAGYAEIARAMFEAARLLGEEIQWGADWDGDGLAYERGEYDGPHFEWRKIA